MNKKGFTLVELLAVVALLGIISVIIIPVSINTLKDAKRRAFKQQIVEIAKAAKIYYQEELADSENDHAYLDLSKQSDRDKLQVKSIIKAGMVDITSNGKVDVIALNDDFCGRKEYNSKQVNLLDKGDLYCLLADSNNGSGITNPGELLGKFNRLETRISELENEYERLAEKKIQKAEELQIVSDVTSNTKQRFLNTYPVGSIYTTISSKENTAAKMASEHGGSWEAYGQGRVLMGVGSNGTTNYSTVDSIGGSETYRHYFNHTHGVPGVAHYHGTNSMSAAIGSGNSNANSLGFMHVTPAPGGNSTYTLDFGSCRAPGHPARSHNTKIVGTTDSATPADTTTNSISSSYTDYSSSIIQPYRTVYMWKRTA